MARKSKAVFKMAGYSYPGTSPMTKNAGPEGKKFDVDELNDDEKEKAAEADYVKTYEGPNAKYPKGHELHVPRAKKWSGANSKEEEY